MAKIKWQMKKAVELFRQGRDTQEIAKTVGLEGAEIRRALRRRGYDVPKVAPGRKYRPETWDAIADLYASGKSLCRIGRHVGLHRTSVMYAVRRMTQSRGLSRVVSPEEQRAKDTVIISEKERRRTARAERNQQIALLYRGGKSTLEIARALKIDPSTSTRVLTSMGVPRRSRLEAQLLAKRRVGIFRKAQRRQKDREVSQGKLKAERIDRMLHLAESIANRQTRLCA